MQKKKQQEVVIRCNDEEFRKYMSPEHNKIVGKLGFNVVVNIFNSFWGPCEVADLIVKRFLETANYNTKTDFISVDKSIATEIAGKT